MYIVFFFKSQASVSIPCQILVQEIHNGTVDLSVANSIFYSTRIPTKVVLLGVGLGKKPNVAQDKIAYDIDTISHDDVAEIHRYLADENKRWKHLKVSYTEFAPYLFTNLNGRLSGITFDIWKISSAKLDLKLDFSKKVKTYADGYQSLAMREVDLALPQDSMWTTMFQVI